MLTVENTGEYDGEEVVQLYLRDVIRSVAPPVRRLKGFKKVFIEKGESKVVNFILMPDDLKFFNAELELVSEPGEFEVFVGGDATAQLKATFIQTFGSENDVR